MMNGRLYDKGASVVRFDNRNAKIHMWVSQMVTGDQGYRIN